MTRQNIRHWFLTDRTFDELGMVANVTIWELAVLIPSLEWLKPIINGS